MITDDPVYIPTLDEIDRMAGLVRPASDQLDPQTRLRLRVAAIADLAAQRETNPQEVRR